MTPRARIVVILAALVTLAATFVVLSPGDDSDEPASQASTATVGTMPHTIQTSTAAAPPPVAQPKYTAIVVRNGKPVGGVKRVAVAHGERARIEVSSTDTTDEVHLHGYDIKRDLEAGGRVRFSFEADADGIFEMELENAGVPIAEVVVSP